MEADDADIMNGGGEGPEEPSESGALTGKELSGMAREVLEANPLVSEEMSDNAFERLSPIRRTKAKLLKDYRAIHPSLIEGMDREGMSVDRLMSLIISDLIESSEDLQGTSLFLESQGDLRNASAITIKRADLLKYIADVASKRKALQSMAGEVDLTSPAFMLFQKLCFDNLIKALEGLKLDMDMINSILVAWQDNMAKWDEDLKKMLDEEKQ